jgi:uncharacterized protein (TIGR03066 family)
MLVLSYRRRTRVVRPSANTTQGDAMRALLGAMVVLAFAGSLIAQDKDKVDPKKLIGKWEPKEGRVVIEFEDKGKITIVDTEGKGQKFNGTYKLDGNRLEIAITILEKEQKETLTVKKLTDEELITTDSKGKDETLKRKK